MVEMSAIGYGMSQVTKDKNTHLPIFPQFSPATLLTPLQGIVLSQPQKIKLNLLSQAPFFQFLRRLTTFEIFEFFLCWVRVQILSSFNCQNWVGRFALTNAF